MTAARLAEILGSHGPVALLLCQILVVLVVSRLVGVGFRAIGQPLVVAEIVAGILLGPSGFGEVAPAWMDALFPASSLAVLSGVSQLGLTLFMFLVGLEFDPGLLQGRARVAASLGPASIGVPFACGVAFAFFLYPRLSSPDIPFIGFALFCGASMAVTAFPVLARILSEAGLTRTSLGALTLTSAAFNDVVAWCLLAFVIAVVRAKGGMIDAWMTTAYTLLFISTMVLGVRPLLARMARRYGSSKHFSQGSLAGVLVLWLLAAIFSELIGIHALFGAFVFGAIIPRQGQLVRNLVDRMEDLVVVLLLPVFFASTGLKTQIGLLNTPELWGICGLVVLVATLGKVGGSLVPALLGGLSWKESSAVAVMMNTRGLMELIILNIGLELGVLSPALFAMLVLMAVVTTFITSPVLKLLFPAEELVALKAGANSVLTTPSLAVLTCVSHPDSVMGLARMTALLCHGTDARAYALRLSSVEENASLFPENHPTEEEDVAQLASRLARGWGVQIQAMSFPSANPARDICEVARIKKVDIILMGAHRALLGSGPLGGTVSEIVNRGDADVVMLLDLGLKAVHRVLFAKGGPHAAAAARLVARLARLPDIIITELEPVSRGNAVELLLTKAVGQDLIITGFEGIWMTTLSSSHLDKGRKFQELSCSLLAVHGAE